jgi:hypothetical protein
MRVELAVNEATEDGGFADGWIANENHTASKSAAFHENFHVGCLEGSENIEGFESEVDFLELERVFGKR